MSRAVRRDAEGVQVTADTHGELSPHVVVRVSGGPVETIEAMRGREVADALERLDAFEEEFAVFRTSLVERLHALVSGAANRTTRRALLAVRRDVFNGRTPRESDLAAARAGLAASDDPPLTSYVRAVAERSSLQVKYEAAYARDRMRARRLLWRAVGDTAYLNGLLAATPALFARTERALGVDPAGVHEAQVRQTGSRQIGRLERGLLRYLVRMTTKATPFGTFCAVLEGVFDGSHREATDDKPLMCFEGDPAPTVSVVRLNKALGPALMERLAERPSVRRRLEIDLNPTVRDGSGCLEFLVSAGRRELFQKLERHATLDLIRSLLQTGQRVQFGDLVNSILALPEVNASRGDVEAYLGELLKTGFLRARTGVSVQDPDWDRPLEAFCRSVEDEHARAAASLLHGLRDGARKYGAAGTRERVRILAECRELFADACAELGIQKNTRRSLIWYEDATADAKLIVQAARTDPLVQDLIEFAGLVLKVAHPRPEQATMRAFFERTYEAGSEVPLLDFHEDFHRNHQRHHVERERLVAAGSECEDYDVTNPFGIDIVDRILSGRRRLTDLVVRRWSEEPSLEEVRISAAEVQDALADVPGVTGGVGRSVGAFVEIVNGRGLQATPALLLHRAGLVVGYGKYFSRFLYLLPKRVRDGVYLRNGRLSRSRLAEISDDGSYNANLHPPLLPWEIAYPTVEGGDEKESLTTADLYIELDPEDPYGLRLVHRPSGERVVPVDLGFQVLKARPALYRLLSTLVPASRFEIAVPQAGPGRETDAGGSGGHSPAVVHRPRLLFGDRLVLARRAWLVPSGAFPRRIPEESGAEYFRRVQAWRKLHGIPSEVYVRIRAEASAGQSQTRVQGPVRASSAAEELAPDLPIADDGPEITRREEGDRAARLGEPRGAVGESRGTESGGGQPTAPAPEFFKPQYVDFESPLLLDLFAIAPRPLTEFTAILEERLPARADLPTGPQGHHAVELVVQVDFPEGADLAGEAKEAP